MIWLYLGFVALIVGLLALDLGVLNRKPHVIKLREALTWSALWIGLGVAFSGVIYLGYQQHWLGLGTTLDSTATGTLGPDGTLIYNDGGSAVIKYLTGFLVEKSLAIDNIFVIAMIFGFFVVPPIYQHRVLFWGIVGALIMRGLMIAVGAALITRFTWIIYVFGGFLILTGLKMLVVRGGAEDLNRNPVVRWVRRVMSVTDRYHGHHFFVRAGSPDSTAPAIAGGPIETDPVVDRAMPGARLATPLFLALVLVELTDVIFAVDSIPAIFAITTDPFLVFTSNIFAILGMRSLYFALAGMIDSFRYLKVALAAVLVVIGGKMMAHEWLKSLLGSHFNFYVLGAVASIIGIGVIASLLHRSPTRSAPTAAAGSAKR
jgi:tellurite resistance protein TerC